MNKKDRDVPCFYRDTAVLMLLLSEGNRPFGGCAIADEKNKVILYGWRFHQGRSCRITSALSPPMQTDWREIWTRQYASL